MALKDFERFISSDNDIIYHHTNSRTTSKKISIDAPFIPLFLRK